VLLKAHYRQPLDWSDTTLQQARATLDGWYGVLLDLADVDVAQDISAAPAALEAALLDDLNTPQAFAVLASLANDARAATTPAARRGAKAALLGGGELLGLLQHDPDAWFKQTSGAAIDAAAVQQLVDARSAAKARRDFAESDRIRAQLLAMGVVVEDTAQGPRWKAVKADDRAA
jgi:cysteinyl-tRNA synthetase